MISESISGSAMNPCGLNLDIAEFPKKLNLHNAYWKKYVEHQLIVNLSHQMSGAADFFDQ